MKKNTIRTALIGIMTIATIAGGTTAFAGRGNWNENRADDGRMYNCPYGNPVANLTDEQRTQLDNERKAFFDATKVMRQDLNAKQLELRAELAKQNPDAARAAALQKEVSELNASLDQKHLEHVFAVRKIHPDAGRGFFGHNREMGHGGGMGHGRGMGMGMGQGPGYCWQ